MICTYLRSSSINTYDLCPHKYFIEFNICKKAKTNIKTDKGSVVHKVLELLAQHKLAQQENRDSFVDDLLGEIKVENCLVDDLIELTYNYFVETVDQDWTHKDYIDCVQWVRKVLNFNDGAFDPRNRNIIAPEQRFDVTIEKPWARHCFDLPNGEHMEGYLTLKGTVDLVTLVRENPKVVEVIDWKTGRRKDWKTDKEIDEDYLKDAIQPRLYHYSLYQIYPDVEDFIFTFFYINYGGPFTVNFDRSDIKITEEKIRKKYTEIVQCQKPRLNLTWKCRWCSFSNDNYQGTGKSSCEYFRNSIQKIGLNETLAKHGDLSSITKYHDGGGRKDQK